MKNPLILIAANALVTSAFAGNVQVQVLDRDGKPVADSVVVLYPASSAAAPPSLLLASPTIEQEKMRFVPAVSVVLPGSTVRLTNQDRWDHHVRGAPAGLGVSTAGSTSAPSATNATPSGVASSSTGFELRLSGKTQGKPSSYADVLLDTPGVMLLSCHLHGSMRGHVFVTDSAWTLKTDGDGIARFAGVPDGAAQVRVWHAEQLVDLPRKALNVVPGPVLDTVQLSVVPRAPRRAPAPASPPAGGPTGGYSQAPVIGTQVAHQH